MERLELFLKAVEKHINHVLFSISSRPNYPYHYKWLITGLGIAIIYFLFKYYKRKSYYNRVLRFVQTKRFQFELKKDILYVSFRLLFKPFYYGVLLLNARNINDFYKNYLGISIFEFEQPLFYLDPEYGIYFLGLFQLLFFDLSIFLSHYCDHKIKWFWYFHMTHHRATSLNFLTKNRTHPISYLIAFMTNLFFLLPGTLLLNSAFITNDSKNAALITSIITFSLFSFIIHIRHSHIRISYGKYLSHILISPHMHQVHHSKNPIHIDKNFGVIFSIWDLIFGTLYIPKTNERFKFGILGEDRKISTTYWVDLYYPFLLLYKDIKRIFNSYDNIPKPKIIHSTEKEVKAHAS